MVGFSLTLPVSLSFLRFFPVAAIRSWTGPGAVAVVLAADATEDAFTPLPDSVSSPGFGTSTVSMAVPFFRFRPSAPKVNEFDGWITALMLTRASRFPYANPWMVNAPDAPSPRPGFREK